MFRKIKSEIINLNAFSQARVIITKTNILVRKFRKRHSLKYSFIFPFFRSLWIIIVLKNVRASLCMYRTEDLEDIPNPRTIISPRIAIILLFWGNVTHF